VLSATHKLLSTVLLLRLTPYVDEISGDYQCGFRCSRSTAGKAEELHNVHASPNIMRVTKSMNMR
jgi:hypothetical protein